MTGSTTASLRIAEAAGCGAVMAVSVVLLYFGDLMTFRAGSLPPGALVMLVVLPSGLASVIGGYVPHIYRSARRAAMARRDEAERLSRPMLMAVANPTTMKVGYGVVAGKAPQHKRAPSGSAGHSIRRKNRENISSGAAHQRIPAEPSGVSREMARPRATTR